MKLHKLLNARRRRGIGGVIAQIILISLVMGMFHVPAYAAGTPCVASGPVSAAYQVTVCITAPADGASVSGVQNVTATVTVTGTNPGVAKLIFYLDGTYLLTDFQAPFTFQLPTTKFVDDTYLLEVAAVMRDAFTSQRASVELTFANGISQPPVNTNTFTPATGTTPPAGTPFVLTAVGDGASGEQKSDAVAAMIDGWDPNMFLYLGNVYDRGTATEFYNWYGSGANRFSSFKDITNPTLGNQDYDGGVALGYSDYWDNVPHYYSFDAAGWHIISLDSNLPFNQTAPGSGQYEWLEDDLNDNDAVCTIAFYHHPRYSVGPAAEATRMSDIWKLLADNGVDIVLNANEHNYQRWHPQNGQGAQSPTGVTQFVVGTGGRAIDTFTRTDPDLAVGVDSSTTAHGALRLELNSQGATFKFVNLQGQVLDSGSIPCSGAPTDTTPPTVPGNFTATSDASNRVKLTWNASTDNVGVSGYDIYRDGVLLTTIAPATSYNDDAVTANTAYSYRIRARDAAGNVSNLSPTSTVTTPGLLFSDGFESGNLQKWNTVSGLVVQQQQVYAGEHAARGTSTGTATYAYKQVSPTQNELYYRLWFKIISRGPNAVFLQRFRTSSNGAIMGLFVNSNGKLYLRNDVATTNIVSATTVTQDVWHQLQVRILINGASGQSEVWLDGARINELSVTQNFGTNPVGAIQLGETTNARTYDIAFDRVALDTAFINPANPPEVVGPPPVTVTTNVWTGVTQRAPIILEHDQATRVNYPGVNDGPVELSSTSADPIVGSEALIYSVNGTAVSFSESMGLPGSQLDDTYWLPWYNNVGLDTQLRIANVTSQTTTVKLFIGGNEVTNCTPIPNQPYPYELSEGESVRVSCVGVNDGPVKIQSTNNVNIVAAERIIYKVNNASTSFTETMALPANQLDDTYWLPWYNNVGLDSQLRIANVTSQTTTVKLFIGVDEVDNCTAIPAIPYPYELAEGESVRVSCAGVNNGPMRVQSTNNVKIVVAERVIYKVNNVNTSFTELMGLPDLQLDNTYWLPWYDNVGMDTQMRFGNVSNTTATVKVFIAGVEMTTGCTSIPAKPYPYELAPGESIRLSCGVNTGPVEIVSTQDIVAAERVIYKANGVNTSYTEMMAMPAGQLDTTFWMPWYNNVGLFSELRLGVP